ncbi:Hpt domain-containing protein [Aquincola sp. MAHUQ-54]|uniref:Hpt domain-containing protein n=1 Tax=Aquincola agrisoli TaxID=3119538 RepID=A0AAW9QCT4_9BURK
MAEYRLVPFSPLRSQTRAPSAETGEGGGGAARSDLPGTLLAMLDEAALNRLRELDPAGQMGLVLRVLRTFDSSMAKLLIQLEQARAAEDFQAIKHVAHTLKSSAASVGALHLSQLCAEIERNVRELQTASLSTQLDAMVTECKRLQTGLKLLGSA